MRLMDIDARHLQDDFAPETPDIDWLPEIGRRDWVLITGDRGISRKPAERLALETGQYRRRVYGEELYAQAYFRSRVVVHQMVARDRA